MAEEGVTFRSYRDGRKVLLTPEISVAAQKDLGADIIIPLDELPPYHITPEALAARRAPPRLIRPPDCPNDWSLVGLLVFKWLPLD